MLEEHEVSTPNGEKATIYRVSSDFAAQMNKDLQEVYASSSAGKQVTVFTAEQLEQEFVRLYVTEDDKAGCGIKANGEIAAVYSNKGARGAVAKLLPQALADGGKYLECFDSYLPKVYGRAGFEKVAAVPFDPNFAPEGWSYVDMAEYNGGKPDVVFMIPIGSGKKFRRFDALTALKPMQPVEPPDWLLDSSIAKKQWGKMNSEERDWVAANADDIRGEYSETMPTTILGLLYAGA